MPLVAAPVQAKHLGQHHGDDDDLVGEDLLSLLNGHHHHHQIQSLLTQWKVSFFIITIITFTKPIVIIFAITIAFL